MIDGTLISPFTSVVAPNTASWDVRRNVPSINTPKSLTIYFLTVESAFAHPNDCMPDCWYIKPELVHNQRTFGSFGFGMSLQDIPFLLFS